MSEEIDSLDALVADVEAENDYAANKEARWRADRCGLLTASPQVKIMKGTKSAEFSKTGITELYATKIERRTGVLRRPISTYQFDFGHENEPLAMEAWAILHPEYTIKSCSDDFDDIIFVKPEIFGGKFGDSPDAYVYDKDGKFIAVAEIKCNISESKFEELRDVEKIDFTHEYWFQFLCHLMCHPEVDKLIWINFCPQTEEVISLELLREDCMEEIITLTSKIIRINIYIDLCISNPEEYKLKDINKWWKEN